MTDSHAHLTSQEILPVIENVLMEFKNEGGAYILNVGHTPKSNIEILSQQSHLSELYKSMIVNSLGIHPEYISEMLSKGIDRYRFLAKVITEYEKLVSTNRTRISAIGECGLDYYHLQRNQSISIEELNEYIEQQKHLFASQVQIAGKFSLPLTIHVRDNEESIDCIEDALKIVSEVGKGSVTGSFHSYTQSVSYIPEIIGLGFYIGVNGICTYPKAENVREIIKAIPLDKILLETDSPYLPPQNVRKNRKFWRKYGAPADIKEIAQMVAEIKEVSYEKIIKQTTENFKNLFLIH